MFADSHGKGIYNSPRSTSDHILKELQKMFKIFTKGDTVVIIAVANNICGTNNKNYPSKTIVELYHSFSVANDHTNIVYITQFHRQDMEWDSSTIMRI